RGTVTAPPFTALSRRERRSVAACGLAARGRAHVCPVDKPVVGISESPVGILLDVDERRGSGNRVQVVGAATVAVAVAAGIERVGHERLAARRLETDVVDCPDRRENRDDVRLLDKRLAHRLAAVLELTLVHAAAVLNALCAAGCGIRGVLRVAAL